MKVVVLDVNTEVRSKIMDIKEKKGFTIVELLIVVAIIAVLIAIAFPVFSAQLEKTRNTVDMHTAKSISNSIYYYFLENPDKLEALTAECNKAGGAHYVQLSVSNINAAVSPILRPALNDAGLIGPYGNNSADRFTELTCKSKVKWGGYRIAVTNYSGTLGKPGDIKIYYWGVPVGGTVHSNSSLGAYQNNTDSTGFKEAMKGLK